MKAGEFKIFDELYFRDLERTDEAIEITRKIRALTPLGLIVIHPPYVCNKASIPWIVQPLIPKSGKYNRASVFHDYLYEYGGFWNERTGEFVKLTQKQCDEIYLGLMKSRGVNKIIRQAQYRALRLFGWYAWNKYRKLDEGRLNGKQS